MPNNNKELVGQFRADYTDYYQTSDSDSPEASRSQLIEALHYFIQDMLQRQPVVKILDVGAGKQVLEQELQSRDEFQAIKDKVVIITVDLADLTEDQLLAKNVHHVQASGDQLPFASGFFDIAFSSMAIDFMPREALSETKRVIKDGGRFLANFHHPNLIEIAEAKMPQLIREKAKRYQKVKFGSASKNIDKYRAAAAEATRRLDDANFILQKFPQVIFQDTEEIKAALETYLKPTSLSVVEYLGEPGENGWFFAQAILGNYNDEY